MPTATLHLITKNVRPDSKGRVTLGDLAKGISSYDIRANPDGSVLLIPNIEIPAAEAWLFRNAPALASVQRGLADSAAKRVIKRPSYAKHAQDPED